MDVTTSNDFFPSAGTGMLDDAFTLDFGIDPTVATTNFHSDFQTTSVTHLDPNADLDSIFDTSIFDQPASFTSGGTAAASDDVWNASSQSQQNSNNQNGAHSPKSSSETSGDRDSSQSSNGDSPPLTRTTRKRGRPTAAAAAQAEGEPAPVKKTRQRKKKKQPSKEEMENKRKKFLERNRLAASKCRSKRKDWTQALEQRYKELTVQHNQLVAEYEGVKAEIDCLKTQLMMHKSCNDESVQKWLQMEAERAVENLRGSQPMSRTNSVGMDYNASRGSSLDYGERSPSTLFSPTTRPYSVSAAGFRSGPSPLRAPSVPSSQAMSRSGSGGSDTSGVMSKRDSGVSDVDFPTTPNIKYELPQDEGYVTSPKPRIENTIEPGLVGYDFQPNYQISIQFGSYLPQSMGSGPTDVINPAEFLAPEVL
ncbi:hypothetical protein F5884DRAFT_757343 [Xylogone sp. PMI_703]|nr:hypothetical protein F5884DRAFT_757343 [Xylogone sp. PMI_703]